MRFNLSKLCSKSVIATWVSCLMIGVASADKPLNVGISEWKEIGDANWEITPTRIQANNGSGFLVSKEMFDDFELKVRFKSGSDTNSGIFIRCSDPEKISDQTCYEINIFDQRPDPSGRTGSIVNLAAPRVSINTEGQWNTFEISAQGSHLVVKLNGVKTVDTVDDRLTHGPIAVQRASGEIEFADLSITRGLDIQKAIRGEWRLTRFLLDDGRGNIQPWCVGSHGTIIYTERYMSVAINCESSPEKKVLYSGPYRFEGTTVVHDVRNFSDMMLNQELRRRVEMQSEHHLDLIGPFGDGGKAVVSWERAELENSPDAKN